MRKNLETNYEKFMDSQITLETKNTQDVRDVRFVLETTWVVSDKEGKIIDEPGILGNPHFAHLLDGILSELKVGFKIHLKVTKKGEAEFLSNAMKLRQTNKVNSSKPFGLGTFFKSKKTQQDAMFPLVDLTILKVDNKEYKIVESKGSYMWRSLKVNAVYSAADMWNLGKELNEELYEKGGKIKVK